MNNEVTQDQIRRFAEAWYLALDQHVPTEEISKLVAAEGLEMVFPEKTLHGLGDFQAWYSGGTYSDGEQAPGVINIFFDENHNVVSVDATITGDSVEVRVVVAWQASWFTPPAAKSRRTSMDATQEWTVRRSSRNLHGLEISLYNAMSKPFQYAPGFARL